MYISRQKKIVAGPEEYCFTGAFGGRGASGPSCVMTDDSASERNALKATWPEATQLLCIFHVLQATWRWLFNQKHGIRHQVKTEASIPP